MARYKKGEWSGKKQKILILEMKGQTNDEIAKQVGYKFGQSVSKVILSEEYQRRRAELELRVVDEARKVLEKHAIEAVHKVVKIMRKGDPNERLQYDAAKEILHQVGCKPIERIETTTRPYTPEEIASANEVVKETEKLADRLSKRGTKYIIAGAKSENVTESPKKAEDGTSAGPVETTGTPGS